MPIVLNRARRLPALAVRRRGRRFAAGRVQRVVERHHAHAGARHRRPSIRPPRRAARPGRAAALAADGRRRQGRRRAPALASRSRTPRRPPADRSRPGRHRLGGGRRGRGQPLHRRLPLQGPRRGGPDPLGASDGPLDHRARCTASSRSPAASPASCRAAGSGHPDAQPRRRRRRASTASRTRARRRTTCTAPRRRSGSRPTRTAPGRAGPAVPVRQARRRGRAVAGGTPRRT